MSTRQAANDAIKVAKDAVRSFEENFERLGAPEDRSAMAQVGLAREATLIRRELAAMRIMLAERGAREIHAVGATGEAGEQSSPSHLADLSRGNATVATA
jgi:hypothetical protein